jgi:hypothetical protein
MEHLRRNEFVRQPQAKAAASHPLAMSRITCIG